MHSYAPLLNSKLYCPTQKGGLVVRDRLHQQLDRALHTHLILVSAPPGYGKTVLASSWASVQCFPVAWLILDKEESNLGRFLAYLIAALNKVKPDAFRATATHLATAELPALEHIVRSLINDIGALREDIVVILDDYHHVDHGSVVHEIMSQIFKCPPPNLHFIILTRRDPPISFSKLRANNQLVDIRQSDLRFQREETAAFLRIALNKDISEAALANVQRTLEGWGAGIRMVSLAARRMAAGDAFLLGLSGSIQQVNEYMFDELIARLDPSTAHYMLCSALPPRFCADLLDAMSISEQAIDGEQFTEFAESSNLFTTPLDASGKWFRYHNLFRDLLRRRLVRAMPATDQALLVARASDWLEAHGQIEDAIHLLIDHDFSEKAALTVERHRTAAFDADQWQTLESWLQKFPVAEVGNWPSLLLTKASLAKFNLDINLIVDLVQQLETHHQAKALSPEQLGELQFYRAVPLFWTGEIAAARALLEQADTAPLPLGHIAGELHVYLSMARTLTGDYPFAVQQLDYADECNGGRRNIFATRTAASKSFVHYVSLQPAKSLEHAERLSSMALEDIPSDHAKGWGGYMRALVLFNTGRLKMAQQEATETLRFGDFLEKRVVVDMLLVQGMCGIYLTDDKGVSDAFKGLKTLAESVPASSDVLVFIQSAIVRLTLLQNQLGAAQKLAAELGRTPSAGTLVFWLEEPSLTWAKALLMEGSKEAAQLTLPLLDLLRELVTTQNLMACQVEIFLLQALAHARLHNLSVALPLLQRSIELALPHNWIGPFAELANGFSSSLIESIKQEDQRAFISQAVSLRELAGGSSQMNASEIQAHQFTNRELDILELLAGRYQNKEIASKLFISSNTVNYHLKHIYQKLEVTSRRKAVTRATQLGILPLDA